MVETNFDDAQHARIRIKTNAGAEYEAEGSQEFVERRAERIEALLDRIDGLRMPTNGIIGNVQPETIDAEAKEPKKITNKRRSSRSGPSCASRILALQDGGYFQQARKSSDIADKLVELATPYEGKHVAAALNFLTKSAKLRRLKNGEGEWTYVNP